MEEPKIDVVENHVIYLVTGEVVTLTLENTTERTIMNAFISGSLSLGLKGVLDAQQALANAYINDNSPNDHVLHVNIINIIPVTQCTLEEWQEELSKVNEVAVDGSNKQD